VALVVVVQELTLVQPQVVLVLLIKVLMVEVNQVPIVPQAVVAVLGL
jgi:hypothetical protein